jgi:hypothetical protein
MAGPSDFEYFAHLVEALAFIGGYGSHRRGGLCSLAGAPLAYSVAPTGTLDVGNRYGLPRLSDSGVILHSRSQIQPLKRRLRYWLLLFGAGMQLCPTGGTRTPIHSLKWS